MGTTDERGIYLPDYGEVGWHDELNANLDKVGRVYGRRMTAAAWTAANPVLELFEVGWETDTRLAKLGDGLTPWAALRYVNGHEAGGFEWEKYSTFQTLANGTAGFPQTAVTDYEAAPNLGGDGPLAAAFNPTTGTFTPPYSGWYYFEWEAQFAANPTGFRYAGIGGGLGQMQVAASPAGRTILSGGGATYLDAPGGPRHFTDTLYVEQGSGGPLDLQYAAFNVVFLGGPMYGMAL